MYIGTCSALGTVFHKTLIKQLEAKRVLLLFDLNYDPDHNTGFILHRNELNKVCSFILKTDITAKTSVQNIFSIYDIGNKNPAFSAVMVIYTVTSSMAIFFFGQLLVAREVVNQFIL